MADEGLDAAIRRGKREWEQTFDAIADPIGVFDASGILLRGNAALAAHVGCDVRELAGRSCGEIGFCGGTCPDCAVRQPASERREAQVAGPDGQIFQVTTFPMTGGGQAAVVQVAKNVTAEIANARRLESMSDALAAANARSLAALEQLKRTRAQLLQVEKLSAIGELVAGLAHELNNPLTSVIGYAQLVLDDLDGRHGAPLDRTALRHDLTRIAEESDRAAKIVRNLLAFARRQAAARALEEPTALIERALGLRDYSLRTAGVTLVRELGTGLPRVLVDANQVQQALLNLVLNAEQAMRDRPVRRLTVAASYREDAAAIELRVADTGHGIARVNLGRIFDPFFTTRDVGEGTGLGLSVCYGVVRDHGGEIAVESRVGVGTTFTLLLPAMLAGVQGTRVLVSHPARDDGAALAAALDAWGYTVTLTTSAEAALAQYRGAPFDLLLVDGGCVSGHEDAWVAARADDGGRTPVILMTVDDSASEEAAHAVRPAAVVAAPFQLQSLQSALRTVSGECV